MQDSTRKKNVLQAIQAEEKIFNFRPIAFCAAVLCCGIFFAYAYCFYEVSLWLLALGVPVLGVPFFFCATKKARKQTLVALGAMGFAFVVGLLGFIGQTSAYQRAGVYDNAPCTVVGTIDKISESDYSLRVVLSNVTIGNTNENGRLVAYLPLSYAQNIEIGNEILLAGKVSTDVAFFNDYGFKATAIGDDLRFEMQAEDCTVIGTPFSLFAFLRNRIVTVVENGMDEESAGVTLGVLLGDTSVMDEGLLENMRSGGIAHVFAVSGLHVGALFAFVMLIVKKTVLKKVPKAIRFFIVAGVLLFYGGICGFSPSVIRAITMSLCFYAARLIGLGSDFLETLGFSAIVVLLLSPVSLFEVGFMLSFAACLGMALLIKPLEKCGYYICDKAVELIAHRKPSTVALQKKNERPLGVLGRIKRTCISYFAMSTSAQIATAPICLWAFGYVSGWGTILNFLFVPIVVTAFSALLILVLIASLLPLAVSSVLLYLPKVVWSVLLLLFQTVDFSSFALSGLTVGKSGMICYYLALAFVSDKLNLKKRTRAVFASVCFLAFGITVYALSL